MTQEEKELLFKNLSGRLPYHVKVKVWLEDWTTEEGVLDLEHNYADVLRDAFYYGKIKDIKPYLRPISSMTDEERKEYKRFVAFSGSPGGAAIFIDWLNAHHFDYLNLLENGLAIEAPEGMYNNQKYKTMEAKSYTDLEQSEKLKESIMNKFCTSIEESKKLMELGLDVNTADMFWDMAEPDKRRKPLLGPISDYYDMEDWAVPSWSLSALLEVMPKCIIVKGENFYPYIVLLNVVSYGNAGLQTLISFRRDTLFDSIFAMVCWLLENNFIKKGELTTHD